MIDGPPPLIVLDVERLDELAPAAERLKSAGFAVRDGLADLPLRTHALVCRAVIDDADAASEAVLAATWGAGLLLAVGGAPAEVSERLIEDLGRVGTVTRADPVTAAPMLHPDAAHLLDLLAQGRSLGDAAREAYLSRRTADRRLAEARRGMGARSTAEAIRLWKQGSPSLATDPDRYT